MDTITRQPCITASTDGLASWPSARTLQPKLYPQLGAHAPVCRTALLNRLEASNGMTVSAILGPPGYGKTTLLAQWAAHDPRPFAWLTVDQQDNDPAVLLRNIAVVLDRVEPLDPALLSAVSDPARSLVDVVLPRLGQALSAVPVPMVLVLDDLHLLQSWDCLEAVAKLIDFLPTGSQLAIASRGEPPLPLARLRAEGRVLEIGPADLAMDEQEASTLFEHTGLHVDPAAVADLVGRTEGWPAALKLAALSSRGRNGHGARAPVLAGDDRFLIDYLQVVVLSRLPARLVTFLARCAVLDRLSGPLCDAVLGQTGSADLLEWLSRSNMLVFPLDRRRRWYRLHGLFRELLLAQLDRDEPAMAKQLSARAADWFEGNGRPEPAVECAMAAGDADRAARLLVDAALPAYVDGRLSTVERWFAWMEAHEPADRYPEVALLGAWVNALAGHPAATERWTEAVEGWHLPDDTPADGQLALLKAALCRQGEEQMRSDAEVALKLAPTGSTPQAAAQLLLGISQLLAGEVDSADHTLADAAEVGEELGLDVAMVALAERSLLAMGRRDWQQAEFLAERARTGARAQWLERYASSSLLHVVLARLAIYRGDVAQGRNDLAHAEGLLPQLTYALPHLAVQVRLELVRNYLALTDIDAAKRALWEVDSLLWRRPQLGALRHQAEELRVRLGDMRQGTIGGSSLTAAEVRLLRLLGTHYSFREIGGQLYLSQHTVKSQAMSIYRKFGVSSRSEAIQYARKLGLVVQ